MQQFGIGSGSKRHLRRPLPLFSHFDAADQITVCIAESGRVLLKLEQRFVKIIGQDEALLELIPQPPAERSASGALLDPAVRASIARIKHSVTSSEASLLKL